MDNQHRKNATYRELDQTEIDLINEIKELEYHVQAKHQKILNRLCEPSNRINEDMMRSASLARTRLQEGFMWLTRAVALPDSLW